MGLWRSDLTGRQSPRPAKRTIPAASGCSASEAGAEIVHLRMFIDNQALALDAKKQEIARLNGYLTELHKHFGAHGQQALVDEIARLRGEKDSVDSERANPSPECPVTTTMSKEE